MNKESDSIRLAGLLFLRVMRNTTSRGNSRAALDIALISGELFTTPAIFRTRSFIPVCRIGEPAPA
jgi:hypothetical protein